MNYTGTVANCEAVCEPREKKASMTEILRETAEFQEKTRAILVQLHRHIGNPDLSDAPADEERCMMDSILCNRDRAKMICAGVASLAEMIGV